MNQVYRLAVLFCFASISLAQNPKSPPKPKLISAQLPLYPVLARLTHTQGEVKVDFILNNNGEPSAVAAVSGNPLLKAAAEDNVKSWRFELPKDLYRTDWKYSSTFNFKISGDEDPYENPKITVVMDSFQYVEVITNPPSNKYAHGCPPKEKAEPPVSIDSEDSVKLWRSGCYGTCPVYEVTIARNGGITWNGRAFVRITGVVHSRIDPELLGH